jgi:hypothetical protein
MGTGLIEARRLASAALLAVAMAGFVQCGGSTTPTPPPPVTAASLQSVSLNPTSIVAGSTVQGTAALSAGAPSGGATVNLTSSNTAAATVPPSVVVAQGSTSATFTVTALAAGTSTISGTYLTVTQTAALAVTAPATHADFVVTPDAGTTVADGQCSASQVTGTSTQKLLCTFDATASTPSAGITEYRWVLPGMTIAQAGAKLSDPIIPCGGFAAAGTQKDVTLAITAPGGTSTITKSITFVKGAPC